eukprot:CAMPEP_0175078932 /NCGR_PEP_ID=MMETSP0052_2-20121109/24488_1 /TAXON_ID=51329 ORGANISM="Polytomella parva, Strain SAG 63-3" /NCGR_SAMPLE_ID=MMETSP0052_2 /ASSEMBLY_ACC=CAM_ASM_000194 /LENGTH=306 /DNA_ID=CAMNT_0016349099 /DNA_START=482 /DNA_END=1399 /DNA_ORIENTATION=-
MARYDLPTSIQYVLSTTGSRSLSYIGHSQGTTTLLAAASTTPALVSSIDVAVLLAPVAMVGHMRSLPLLAMAALGTDELFKEIGIREFLPSEKTASRLEGQLCTLQPWLCISFLTALCGFNPSNLDLESLPQNLNFTPAGTSVSNMAHWAQSVRLKLLNGMSYYDFGSNCGVQINRRPTCNEQAYGSVVPPKYDLTKIRKPNFLALFFGGQDRLATPMDDEFLLESLWPGVVQSIQRDPDYEHLDYIWGKNAPERVYDKVIEIIEQVNTSSRSSIYNGYIRKGDQSQISSMDTINTTNANDLFWRW